MPAIEDLRNNKKDQLYVDKERVKTFIGKIKIAPEEYTNLQKKGLVNSGVNQEFFYRSLEDADFDKLLYNKNKLVKGGAKLIDGIAKVYRAEDDIFKVYNYYK